jgi:hypothetical protein
MGVALTHLVADGSLKDALISVHLLGLDQVLLASGRPVLIAQRVFTLLIWVYPSTSREAVLPFQGHAPWAQYCLMSFSTAVWIMYACRLFSGWADPVAP